MHETMPEGNRPNPPAHTLRLAVSGTFLTSRWANVFWVRNGNAQAPGLSDLEAVTQALGDAFATAVKSELSGNWSADLASSLYYGSAGADLGVDAPLAHTGSRAEANLPASIAMVISWKVQQRYKGGHPRTYLSGMTAGNQQDVQTWKPSSTAAVASAANDLVDSVRGISAGNLTDLHLGVVSFVLRNEWRTPPVFRDYVLDAATVDARIDTQRRRLGRDLA